MSGARGTVKRLALVGTGKMGRLVAQLAREHGFEIVLRIDSETEPAAVDLSRVDVAIDFSTAAATPLWIERLAPRRIPLVVGTTGWLAELPRLTALVEQAGGALVHGANFSIGVQVFYGIVAQAARLLASESDYDPWLYEIHHRMKKDAPSGTLRELRRVLADGGYGGRPIDAASNRAGAIPGTHRVGFDSDADTIVLEHIARNRAGFARGALRAARWVQGRTGVHAFRDVWEQIARGGETPEA
ncbi:MAG TPA: dihydrodipicolinate reductase C-terminal domain-containing protein [Thermoanaerobaculia bacterium]